MKLLSIDFTGLKMFEGGRLHIDFFASDRVPSDDQSVFPLEKPIYTNKVVALAGINAAGKTSTLRLIKLALAILNGRSVDNYPLCACFELFQEYAGFQAVFFEEDSVWILESEMEEDPFEAEEFEQPSYLFMKERLYMHPAATITKKDLSDIDALKDKAKVVAIRHEVDLYDDDRFISPTMSIVASLKKGTTRVFHLGSQETSLLPMRELFEVDEALHVLDSNIEYMKRRPTDDGLFEIKLKNESDSLVVDDRDLRGILSTGTLRGLRIINGMLFALKAGGYVLLDEVESHLNKQIVRVLLDLFASDETNPFGATLVFTTHYPELLDDVHRKDNTYFLVRDSNSKTQVIKYSDAIKRIENKKSEVFLSNYIKGTAPKYTDIEALKTAVKATMISSLEEATLWQRR